jgi:hypothetical protein
MTRKYWVPLLISVLLVLQVTDFALTGALAAGRHGDVIETNPPARPVLDGHGWPGLAAFKFGCVALALVAVAGVWRWRPQLAVRALGCFCGAMALVVGYSALLLLSPPDPDHQRYQNLARGKALVETQRKTFNEYTRRRQELCLALLDKRMSLEEATNRHGRCLMEWGDRMEPKYRSEQPRVDDRVGLAADLVKRTGWLVEEKFPERTDRARELDQEFRAKYGDAAE